VFLPSSVVGAALTLFLAFPSWRWAASLVDRTNAQNCRSFRLIADYAFWKMTAYVGNF
jgi:hypothetical protein